MAMEASFLPTISDINISTHQPQPLPRPIYWRNTLLILSDSPTKKLLLLLQRIESFVLRYPGYFTQNPERMKDLLHRLENDFRVPPDSPILLYGLQVLSNQSKSKLEKKFGIFKSFGWSDDDVLMMFRRLPHCITLSEDRIQEALSFYMKKHGCAPAYLASHPSLLILNLEKRVIPRIEVLKILDERKVERRKLGLYTALRLTETKFIDYFVLPYKDQVPDLYEQLKKIVAP